MDSTWGLRVTAGPDTVLMLSKPRHTNYISNDFKMSTSKRYESFFFWKDLRFSSAGTTGRSLHVTLVLG